VHLPCVCTLNYVSLLVCYVSVSVYVGTEATILEVCRGNKCVGSGGREEADRVASFCVQERQRCRNEGRGGGGEGGVPFQRRPGKGRLGKISQKG